MLRHGGVVVADTADLVRVLETSHPPTFYLPRAAFGAYLQAVERTTGVAPDQHSPSRNPHLAVAGSTTRRRENHDSPFCEWKGRARYVDVTVPGAAPLRDIASDVVGPFKGGEGSWGW